MAESQSLRNDPCGCGSGLKFKKCCLRKKTEGSRYEGLTAYGPRQVFAEGASISSPPPKPQAQLRAIQRIGVHYMFPEQFGMAKVEYAFSVRRAFILEGGVVMSVERLAVGARFLMQHGEIATVTAVQPPAWWEPPADRPSKGKTLDRRVIGRSERFGNAVLDLSFLGRTVTTTPDHLFYSFSRKTYLPAEQLNIGELLATDNGSTATLDAMSPPRYGLVRLFNIEVEELHNYFVGEASSAVRVHNGVPGAAGSGIPMPAVVCFAAGTAIVLADGTTKPIEKIEKHDRVKAAMYNDPDGPISDGEVIEVYHHEPRKLIEVEVGGHAIRCTPKHPFYVLGRGFTAADKLNQGDELRTSDGGWTAVGSISDKGQVEPVFNFQVARLHTYFVRNGEGSGSVLVHNDSGLKPEQKKKLIDVVSGAAEWVHDFFEKHPISQSYIDEANSYIDSVRKLVKDLDLIETDPEKMGWFDLTTAWFLELGGEEDPHDHIYDFNFGPDSLIAKDVLKLDAVQKAIKDASKEIREAKERGDPAWPWGGSKYDEKKPPWKVEVHFRVDDAVRTVREMDKATGFLGSYDITIKVRSGSGELVVIITNTIGWDSGTRFRKPAKGKGQNQGVFHDRLRNGGGLHVGGTIRQTIKIIVPLSK